jgi:hypothetical protein
MLQTTNQLVREQMRWEIVTFIREPLQYALKCYALRNAWDRAWVKIYDAVNPTVTVTEEGQLVVVPILEDATLLEWLEHSYWRWNIISRVYAGTIGRRHEILNGNEIEEEEAVANNNFGTDVTTSALYTQAMENIGSVAFFGVFEDMENSYELFFHTFCFSRHDYWSPSEMRPLKSRVPDADTIALSQKRNRVDDEFYKAAVALYETRVAVMKQDRLVNGNACRFKAGQCAVTATIT